MKYLKFIAYNLDLVKMRRELTLHLYCALFLLADMQH